MGNLFLTIDKMQKEDQEALKLINLVLTKNPSQSLQPVMLVKLISSMISTGMKLC